MIEFHTYSTPNTWKVGIMLEECALPYQVHLVDITKGEQLAPAFAAISPNQRMPAIVDHDVADDPVPVFESGAIMLYLAEKTGRFLPEGPLARKELMEWMFWQVGNLGPMGGQHSHYWNYAPEAEKQGYSAQRYRREYIRCIETLERRLAGREYLLDSGYTIADMINWPWILIAKAMGVPLEPYPHVTRWRQTVKERPAVQRGVALAKDRQRKQGAEIGAEERRILFNQTEGDSRRGDRSR